MTDFTKMSSRHCGQPCYPNDPGDELANGPVVTYRMSPEEIAAKYGPPVPRVETRRQKLSRENLTELLRTKTVGQVAERYCVPQKLIFGLCDKYELELDEKNRLVGGDDDMAHGDKIKAARIALPREKYEELIAHGLTDQEVADAAGIKYHMAVRLKGEYGLSGNAIGRNQFTKRKEQENMYDDNVPAQERVETNTGNKMTIAQAVVLRGKMSQELQIFNAVEKALENIELTPGIDAVLVGYRDECNQTLEQINRAFETTEIVI